MSDKVTLICTSSNRFDLLERTLDSFLKLNKFPIHSYIINEDSTSQICARRILEKYGRMFKVLYHPKREGYARALDYCFGMVETEWAMNIEDDWLFYGNPNFIAESMKILKDNKDIHQVWIRDHDDHRHELGDETTISGIKVRPVLKGYQNQWHGFSLNPGLRRMSDIKKFFPNGLREFGDEIICNAHVERLGYRAVTLCNTSIKHIGWNRHVRGFKI